MILIEGGTIKDDLFRRDFTINSMVWQYSGFLRRQKGSSDGAYKNTLQPKLCGRSYGMTLKWRKKFWAK